jgi:D-alanyl-lipoteichoic acid acyltransferase DltB (MBOAT superfamily)
MLFPTVEFAVFFPIVLFLSWALMSRQAPWKVFIIAASYVFYGAADPKFCLLLAGVTVGNQIAARLIADTDDQNRRKWILRIAVGLDLLALGFFKYYGSSPRTSATFSTRSGSACRCRCSAWPCQSGSASTRSRRSPTSST